MVETFEKISMIFMVRHKFKMFEQSLKFISLEIDPFFSLTGSQTITSRSQVHRSDQAVLINADSQSDPTIPSIQKQLPEGYRDAFG